MKMEAKAGFNVLRPASNKKTKPNQDLTFNRFCDSNDGRRQAGRQEIEPLAHRKTLLKSDKKLEMMANCNKHHPSSASLSHHQRRQRRKTRATIPCNPDNSLISNVFDFISRQPTWQIR